MFKKGKKISVLLIIMVLAVSLTACSGGSDEKNEIVLLEGQFSEITILMNMAGILIEENTDLDVVYHDSMNTVAAANANKAGEVDLYVSYDGTMLTTILGSDPSELPEGEDLYEWTKAKASEEIGLTLTEKFGFQNTYAIAVQEDFATENNLVTTSDLVSYAPKLVFGAEHEFFDEEGTMRFGPFNETYGMEWGDSKSIDMGLKFSAMDNNNIDVTMVYSTDGLIKKSNLTILEDDLKFFPQYYAAFQVRDTLFEEFAETAPNLEEILNSLAGLIDDKTMMEMNYAVDAEGKTPHEVAKAFLVENNLSE
ncbi:glycine betaine ABC transporter substrate-binding protein [Tissierella sp. Yu-01]|uniref:glycine betaine ABC transporter substrate-binding protein n=1 Tax=Tissierella sp. Yu-01 TaxID=3035694 RepID=UPI00240D39D7|nr:glycine betaine ABC transporter substrate-binding protein [Tissierella sp. Yu-01]WFA09351.1 glycine betaine ABC transporter substrate-binding protein [Tissierella sp. Yu-01]